MLDIIPTALMATTILLFGVAFVVLIVLEKSFIKNRKKEELVLPALVTVLAVVFIATSGAATISSSGASWASISVYHGEQYLGDLSAALDRESKDMKAVGTFTREKGDAIDYIDLEFKVGELVGTEQALPYKADLEQSLKPFLKANFTGKSVSYDELRVQADQVKRTFSMQALAYAIGFYGLLPAILWLMYVISKWNRKRKNLLRQTKLKDL